MWKIHFWISNFCISSFGNLGNTWLGHNAIESECTNFQSLSSFFFHRMCMTCIACFSIQLVYLYGCLVDLEFLWSYAGVCWVVFHNKVKKQCFSKKSIKAAFENVCKLEQNSLIYLSRQKAPPTVSIIDFLLLSPLSLFC